MTINPTFHRFSLAQGDQLEIRSFFGQAIATVPINLSFFQERFSELTVADPRAQQEGDWRDVSVGGLPGDRAHAVSWSCCRVRGQAVSKICRISMTQLQRAVDHDITARGERLFHLVQGGRQDEVIALLKTGSISEQSRTRAFQTAVNLRHEEIVEALLANGSISSYERGCALSVAAQHGDEQILDAILFGGVSSGHFEDYQIGAALNCAATAGHIEIVDLLLKASPISDSQRGRALVQAASHGHIQIVQLLLRQNMQQWLIGVPAISEESRGIAVVHAAAAGHIQIVTDILAQGAIPNDNLGGALIQASSHGHSEIVSFLFLQPEIGAYFQAMALESAINAGHQAIADLLRRTLPAEVLQRGQQEIQQEIQRGQEIVARNGQGVVYNPPIVHNPDQIFEGGRYYVEKERLKAHPAEYLAALAANGIHPVTYLNPDGTEQVGVDAGGLTKQFICELGDQLIVQKVIERDELGYPLSSKADLTPYTQLGQLLSHLYTANQARRDSLFIGEIFNPCTYALLQILAKPENSAQSPEERRRKEFTAISKALVTPNTQPLLDFLNKKTPSDSEIQALKGYLGACLTDVPEGITVEGLREICFTSLDVQKYHDTLSAILRGLSTELKVKILQNWDVAGILQGGINEGLLGKLECNSQNPVILKKLEWLREKIRAELADPEKKWIKSFLKCVTGQSVMPSGNIVIRETSNTMCHAHTCFSILDVPNTYEVDPRGLTPQEKFIKRLEVTMGEEGFTLT